ncbi:hypothetical protein HaLaN_20260 [Haematococcus lacustris]|uniref:Uncharacterized protein n=1 Tax=Haematococcus lacustris TaxID=44745 RepID=A0A699ZWW8_HAELA|nr:hypothetical protein HaLaN_20260 [Haematococcus lacustris]
MNLPGNPSCLKRPPPVALRIARWLRRRTRERNRKVRVPSRLWATVSFPSRQATTGASGWLDHAQTSGDAPALCVPALFVTPPAKWPVKMLIVLGRRSSRSRRALYCAGARKPDASYGRISSCGLKSTPSSACLCRYLCSESS